jgi:hypothetical protein
MNNYANYKMLRYRSLLLVISENMKIDKEGCTFILKSVMSDLLLEKLDKYGFIKLNMRSMVRNEVKMTLKGMFSLFFIKDLTYEEIYD